jgi:hypothetical protein
MLWLLARAGGLLHLATESELSSQTYRKKSQQDWAMIEGYRPTRCLGYIAYQRLADQKAQPSGIDL